MPHPRAPPVAHPASPTLPGAYGKEIIAASKAFRADFQKICFGAVAFHRPNEKIHQASCRLEKFGNDVFDTQLPQSKKADLKADGSGDVKAKDEGPADGVSGEGMKKKAEGEGEPETKVEDREKDAGQLPESAWDSAATVAFDSYVGGSAADEPAEVCLVCGGGADPDAADPAEACLLSCTHCGEAYHAFCTPPPCATVNEETRRHWVCPRCKRCAKPSCGKPIDGGVDGGADGCPVVESVRCSRCDKAYHAGCMPGNSAQEKRDGCAYWMCYDCRACEGCGRSHKATAGQGSWSADGLWCAACAHAGVEGRYCGVCSLPFDNNDLEAATMVQCDRCELWVHPQCDGMDEQTYMAYTEGAPGYESYLCCDCRPEDSAAAEEPMWRLLARMVRRGQQRRIHFSPELCAGSDAELGVSVGKHARRAAAADRWLRERAAAKAPWALARFGASRRRRRRCRRRRRGSRGRARSSTPGGRRSRPPRARRCRRWCLGWGCPWAATAAASATAAAAARARHLQVRALHGCLNSVNCGTCISCVDMPVFGGSGVRRQACLRAAASTRRRCLLGSRPPPPGCRCRPPPPPARAPPPHPAIPRSRARSHHPRSRPSWRPPLPSPFRARSTFRRRLHPRCSARCRRLLPPAHSRRGRSRRPPPHRGGARRGGVRRASAPADRPAGRTRRAGRASRDVRRPARGHAAAVGAAVARARRRRAAAAAAAGGAAPAAPVVALPPTAVAAAGAGATLLASAVPPGGAPSSVTFLPAQRSPQAGAAPPRSTLPGTMAPQQLNWKSCSSLVPSQPGSVGAGPPRFAPLPLPGDGAGAAASPGRPARHEPGARGGRRRWPKPERRRRGDARPDARPVAFPR